MTWATKRTQPYTSQGIKRLRCIRCGGQAWSQWQICADGNNQRPLCKPCDVELNRLVLTWAGHPDAAGMAERYATTKGASLEA